jgi:SAM-dependent methyltransferase
MIAADNAKVPEVPWDRTLNLHAYKDVEAPENYATPEALESYRSLLLRQIEPVAQLIEKHVAGGRRLKVLELCSGSSRLLFSLHQKGLLEVGVGVEVSPSRHRFAEAWKSALGVTSITNVLESVESYEFLDIDFDLIVIIDSALSYLYPCDPGLPRAVLQGCRARLAPGGVVLFENEILDDEQIRALKRDGAIRFWTKGAEQDRFKYSLYELEPVDWDNMVFRNSTCYIGRGTQPEARKQQLEKYYQVAELTELLAGCGFEARHYSSFALGPFQSGSKSLVTLASPR